MVDRQFLQNSADLLRGLGEQELEQVAKVAREFEFRHGEYLFRQGDKAQQLFIIYSGGIDLSVPLQVCGQERQVTIEELSPGMTLAWSALVEPHVFTASARASRASQLVGFDRADLMSLFESQPHLGWKVMGNLARVVSQRLEVTKALWLREFQRSVTEKYG